MYECKKLREIPRDSLLFYDLQLEFQYWAPKSDFKQKLVNALLMQIKSINSRIDVVNRNIILLNKDYERVKVNKIKISKTWLKQKVLDVLKEIKLPKGKSDEIMPHIQSSVYSLIDSIIDSVSLATDKVVSMISDQKRLFTTGVRIPAEFNKSIIEVIDLYILGYRSTAMLVMGKIYETILTRILLHMIKTGKVKSKSNHDIFNMTFDSKLNYLYSLKYIPKKDWLIISKLILDRNIGGHVIGRRKEVIECYQEALPTLQLAFKMLNKYYQKESVLKKLAGSKSISETSN